MSLTGLAFLICFVVGLGLALFRHPRYGLYTYLAVFYLDPHSRWWGAMLPPIRWSLIVGVVMLIATLRMPPRRGVVAWYETTPARLLMVFSIWLWLQNFWALSPADHLQASILFTKYIVLFAVIYRMMETPADVKECMFVHVAGCAYLGWLAYRAPGGGRLEGVGGPGIDEANALAMFIGTGIVCGAMLILAERRWKQWISAWCTQGVVGSTTKCAVHLNRP